MRGSPFLAGIARWMDCLGAGQPHFKHDGSEPFEGTTGPNKPAQSLPSRAKLWYNETLSPVPGTQGASGQTCG